MVYEVQYLDFVADKHGFFATAQTTESARARANDPFHHYGYIATNEELIRGDFDLLFDRLQKDDTNRDAFWVYCYYLCIMLQRYHQSYSPDETVHQEKADEYLQLRKKIKRRIKEGIYPKDKLKEENFISFLSGKIIDGLIELIRSIISVSKIKNKISLANLSRIYWFFSRTTVTKSLLYARELKLLDKISSIFGKHIDVDKIIKFLERPKPITNALSVGFLVTRFLINAGLLLRHTFLPSDDEKKHSMIQRFCDEIYKRHAEFLNDIVWSLVNLLTNYNQVFHIAEATAGWMLAGYLFFDFCLIVWQLHLAEQEYLTKTSQLHCDLHYFQEKLRDNNLSINDRKITEEHCRLLTEEIKQLDISWQARKATFIFIATAAFILMAGFSASMLFTGPVIVIACFMICTFGMAMYLSNSSYNSYKEKQFKLHQAQIENKDVGLASQEYIKARNEFIVTMVQNALLPTLVIATISICWPAAVALAAAFIGYKLWDTYKGHAETQEAIKQEQNSLVFQN